MQTQDQSQVKLNSMVSKLIVGLSNPEKNKINDLDLIKEANAIFNLADSIATTLSAECKQAREALESEMKKEIAAGANEEDTESKYKQAFTDIDKKDLTTEELVAATFSEMIQSLAPATPINSYNEIKTRFPTPETLSKDTDNKPDLSNIRLFLIKRSLFNAKQEMLSKHQAKDNNQLNTAVTNNSLREYMLNTEFSLKSDLENPKNKFSLSKNKIKLRSANNTELVIKLYNLVDYLNKNLGKGKGADDAVERLQGIFENEFGGLDLVDDKIYNKLVNIIDNCDFMIRDLGRVGNYGTTASENLKHALEYLRAKQQQSALIQNCKAYKDVMVNRIKKELKVTDPILFKEIFEEPERIIVHDEKTGTTSEDNIIKGMDYLVNLDTNDFEPDSHVNAEKERIEALKRKNKNFKLAMDKYHAINDVYAALVENLKEEKDPSVVEQKPQIRQVANAQAKFNTHLKTFKKGFDSAATRLIKAVAAVIKTRSLSNGFSIFHNSEKKARKEVQRYFPPSKKI